MDILITIGSRLRELRTARKESLRTASRKTKVSASKISNIERGKVDFKLDVLFSLCKHYKINPKDLLQDL